MEGPELIENDRVWTWFPCSPLQASGLNWTFVLRQPEATLSEIDPGLEKMSDYYKRKQEVPQAAQGS